MDHEKPEVVTVHVNESLPLETLRESSQSTIAPDIDYTRFMSLRDHENVEDVEGQKERRGTRLWYA